MVEVALIRPGPIQGGSVHPYIRRRNGQEELTYLHPLLENSLEKTLGVPLFQEQLMQMAIDVAGFTRGRGRPAAPGHGLEALGRGGWSGCGGASSTAWPSGGSRAEVAEEIWEKLAAFANFGFPESHSVCFAYLVYASSWLKRYHPAAFCAALLNAQPMGFYSPHTLVQDARRHGVEVRTPDVNASAANATLEPPNPVGGNSPPNRGAIASSEWGAHGPGCGWASGRCGGSATTWPRPSPTGGPTRVPRTWPGAPGPAWPSSRRWPPPGPSAASAWTGGPALWGAGAVAQGGADRLAGVVTGVEAPHLPGLEPREEALADLWATGISPDGHPTRFVREELDRRGVVTALALKAMEDGVRVVVGGVVTHRQRPATASGITFLNLEDETGLVNVVVLQGLLGPLPARRPATPALLVRGRLEQVEGVINVVAERIEPLPVATPQRSRDFR